MVNSPVILWGTSVRVARHSRAMSKSRTIENLFEALCTRARIALLLDCEAARTDLIERERSRSRTRLLP